MPSQGEKHNLFHNKMVKIYTLFQNKIAQNPNPLGIPTCIKPL